MARGAALAAAIVVSLLAVSGAGGADVQTPKRGGTVVVGPVQEPTCLNPLVVACEGLTTFWVLEQGPRNVVRRDARVHAAAELLVSG